MARILWATLRDTVRASLPEGPFTLPGRAWLALGTVPGANEARRHAALNGAV
jgi:hypothetical protein